MTGRARTTIRLDRALMLQAKREAARRGQTLTALIKQGLWLVLSKGSGNRRKRVALPVCRAGGGVLPGVDLNDSAGLLDVMEGRR